MLVQEVLKCIEGRGFSTIIAHAVEFEGHINAQKLLEKFQFEELYRVKNYWQSIYPGEYCKQCKDNHCHCGVVVFRKRLS